MVDGREAEAFIRQYYAEQEPACSPEPRVRAVLARIAETGTYVHTPAELTFGARVAWRNSARCVGRLYWNSLRVRDRRGVRDAAGIAAQCVGHLREATRNGRIRSTITIFAPDTPTEPGPVIHNDQLIRYACHRTEHGGLRGDPRHLEFTDRLLAMGWQAPEHPGRFDVLPLLIETRVDGVRPFELPADAVLQVPLRHPQWEWFAALRLRWHAVPAISNMPLEIGGIRYPAAPFNGWYQSTEIGARNLADPDRYDLLPMIAERMGLDTSSPSTLWRDRAVVELTVAVQHSFEVAGVSITDHHTEAGRFITHVAREEAAGRSCPADWSWVVPPLSGSQTPVFHRYYDQPDPRTRPAFLPPTATQPAHCPRSRPAKAG